MASRENGPNSDARQLPPTLDMLANGGKKLWGRCANGASGSCFGAGTGQTQFLIIFFSNDNFPFFSADQLSPITGRLAHNVCEGLTQQSNFSALLSFLRQHNFVAAQLLVRAFLPRLIDLPICRVRTMGGPMSNSSRKPVALLSRNSS
jgi:hypothetical protein